MISLLFVDLKAGISICHTKRCICCPRLCFFIVFKRDGDLFVYRYDSLMS